MNKTIHYILTAIFGLAALVILVLHLIHWGSMHSTIRQWEAALSEHVIADARLSPVREEFHELRRKLSDCRGTLAYKKGYTDPALEKRIANRVAELEAEDRATAVNRAETAANAKTLRLSKAIRVVMRFFDNVAHHPQSVKVQEWGDLTLANDGTYLLPVRWSWRSRMGVEVYERKIFRISPEGNILQLIDF